MYNDVCNDVYTPQPAVAVRWTKSMLMHQAPPTPCCTQVVLEKNVQVITKNISIVTAVVPMHQALPPTCCHGTCPRYSLLSWPLCMSVCMSLYMLAMHFTIMAG